MFNSLPGVQLSVLRLMALMYSRVSEVHSVYETTQTVRLRRLFVLICGERPALHGTEDLFSCGQSEAHSCAVAFEIDIMRSRRREESVLSRELPRGRSQTRRESLTRGTRGKLVPERTRNPDWALLPNLIRILLIPRIEVEMVSS